MSASELVDPSAPDERGDHPNASKVVNTDLAARELEEIRDARHHPCSDDHAKPDRDHVLVIDEEPMIVESIERILSPEHRVTAVATPREAAQLLANDSSFDLVLCDVIVPDFSGIDLYEQVRNTCPGLAERFVFMAGSAFTQQAADFLVSVPNARIDKPFRPDDLRALVRELLWRHTPHDVGGA